MIPRDDHTRRGAKVVLGGFLIHLVLGTVYCWGNLTTYITSYLRLYHPGLTYNDTIVCYACSMAAQALLMYSGGLIGERLGPRRTCLIGSGLFCFSVFLSSTALLYLLYGIGCGAGCGLCYAQPIACAYKYFPHRKGLVSGIVTGGFGAGALVFNEVATTIANPHNLPVDLADGGEKYFGEGPVTDAVPRMFVSLGAIYTSLMFVGCMLLRDPPNDAEAKPHADDDLSLAAHGSDRLPLSPPSELPATQGTSYTDKGSSSEEEDSEPLLSSHEGEPCVTPRQLIAMPRAWHLSLSFGLGALPGLVVLGTYKKFGLASGIGDDHFMGYVVGSLGSIGNATGRVAWGYASDWIGQFQALLLMIATLATLLATWHLSVNPLHSEVAFAAWVMAICFCHGANFSITPSLTASLFGTPHVAPNFGLVFLPYGMVSLCGIALIPRMSPVFTTISYILAGVSLIALLSIFLLKNCYVSHRRSVPRQGRVTHNSNHHTHVHEGGDKVVVLESSHGSTNGNSAHHRLSINNEVEGGH